MIKGLKPRLAEIGKIKIGNKGKKMPSRNGGEYRIPQKLDHFVVTTTERDDSDDFIHDEHIMTEIGSNAKSLDIILLYDDIDLNFPTRYALYSGKTCKCSGDGEKAMRNLSSGEVKEIDCNPEVCEFFQQKKCKVCGVLNCLLAKANRLGGVYKLRTHSWNSVNNILSSLMFIQTLTGGVLAGITFQLTLTPKTVEVNGKSIKIHMLNIEYTGQAQKLLENAVNIAESRIKRQIDMKKIEFQAKRLSVAEDTETVQGIIQEFYPENQESLTESPQEEIENNANSEKFAPEKEVKVDESTGEVELTEEEKALFETGA